MAILSSERLLHLLMAALPGSKQLPSPNAPKPVLLQVPEVGRVRIYLWTTTPDESQPGARPEDEHKSQIIIPGTERGSRQHLQLDDVPTFVMGYSPLFGVFVAWEAERHQDSAYSKNLQVRGNLLAEATRDGWAIDAPRRTNLGQEVRAAIHPAHLARYLQLSIEADAAGLEGDARRAFLIASAPDLDDEKLAAKIAAGEDVEPEKVERKRVEARGTRLKRAAGFSKRVLHEFRHSCAVCEIQLSILEGAHIIPVHDPEGTDEVWNGLALCRNHHTLFDRRILLIDPDVIVRADEETLEVLKAAKRLGGYEEIIGVYRDRVLKRLPTFFRTDRGLTRRMVGALEHTYKQS